MAGFETSLKAGVSLWVINFVISIVVAIVMAVLVYVMGMGKEQGGLIKAGIVFLAALATSFAVSGVLLRHACNWSYGVSIQ